MSSKLLLASFSIALVVTLSAQSFVYTLAGSGSAGYLDANYSQSQFDYPYGVDVGPNGAVYVADAFNNCIRKIDSGLVTTYAGGATAGYVDGPASAARFNTPTGLHIDSIGNVYVADNFNNRIRKIDVNGMVTTIAGSGPTGASSGSFVNGAALTTARFFELKDIWVDNNGVVYAADYENQAVRKLENGMVTDLGGSWNDPRALVGDNRGNLFVCDQSNHIVKRIDQFGTITIIAGSGLQATVDGIGTAASLNAPTGIDFDDQGNLLICEGGGNTVRRIDTTTYYVETIAGTAVSGYQNGTASQAQFDFLMGLAFDPVQRRIFLGDRNNNVVRGIRYEIFTEVNDQQEIRLEKPFPNPTNGLILIAGDFSDSKQIVLFDLQGEQQKELKVKRFIDRAELNISDLAAGTYMLLIIDNSGETKQESFRVVKQ